VAAVQQPRRLTLAIAIVAPTTTKSQTLVVEMCSTFQHAIRLHH
jgi:hypothetical protein